MPQTVLIMLIFLLPFAGFLIPALVGRKMSGSLASLLGVLLMAACTAICLYTAWSYFFVAGKVNGIYADLIPFQYTWLRFSEHLSIDIGILLDPISVMMLVVVSVVSLMVHIFSSGYMKGEERTPMFFSYLGLFTFSMLGLVVSSNIFQMYMFWELVGVSSFLLIGFYFEKISAMRAARKAFIVTRFADLGFLIGILVLGYYGGTYDFTLLIQRLTDNESPFLRAAMAGSFLGISAISWALVLVFMGGAGKSAMFPLHIWLPDAMEGPTPVSALIHAATMVVAGVFLVARLFPVFSMASPHVLSLVGYIGLISSVIAAVIACTQTDIKRVLAYSTMSQIGYMMFALGFSGFAGEEGLGYTGSMFHLFTHAGFKALLFLGAGAVIHYVHSNEMDDMGGLSKLMPVTHITFLIACLAIAGIPPFSGFFSKEAILLSVYHHSPFIFYIALATSGLTAFYMFRLYFSIFWKRSYHGHGSSHGEGGMAMMMPLVILAVVTVASGFIPFGQFISADRAALPLELHLAFSVAPVLVALGGIALAYRMYKKENELPSRMASSLNGLYRSAYHKFYIDEIYLFITRKLLYGLIARPAAWFDRNVIDGLVVYTGDATQTLSDKIKGLQSGKVQQYAAWFLLSVVLLALLFMCY